MNPPPRSTIVSLPEQRRIIKTILFLAATITRQPPQPIGGIECPVPDVKHLPALGIDIGVTRDRMTSALRRKMLGWVRRRGTTVLLGHLRDVAGFAELSVSIWLCDGGVVALEDYSLFTNDARRFWLVAQPGQVLFTISREGLLPTLTEPWQGGDEARLTGIAYAEDLLAAFIWED
jgi:hypothetical protein